MPEGQETSVTKAHAIGKRFDKLGMVNRVYAESKATGPSRFLLVTLATFAWKGDTVHPTQETLATMLNVTARTVRNLLAGLLKSGELQVVRKGGAGRGNYAIYRIVLDEGERRKECVVKAEKIRQDFDAERRKRPSTFVIGKNPENGTEKTAGQDRRKIEGKTECSATRAASSRSYPKFWKRPKARTQLNGFAPPPKKGDKPLKASRVVSRLTLRLGRQN